jgi:cephalosporin hydroxylase
VEGLPGATIDDFHRLYYDSETWKNTHWLGVPALKCPLDLWVYQEILFETKPDLIIECGTFMGGSAFFLASIFDLMGHGRVVTIDVEDRGPRPKHKRITYLLGSSVAQETVARVRRHIKRNERVMVILDSDHTRDHVLAEMRTYGPLVTPGCYMIVEDTNINGHPVYEDYGPGPMEALDLFLAENSDFEIDPAREKFFLTFNPRGWLRRR